MNESRVYTYFWQLVDTWLASDEAVQRKNNKLAEKKKNSEIQKKSEDTDVETEKYDSEMVPIYLQRFSHSSIFPKSSNISLQIFPSSIKYSSNGSYTTSIFKCFDTDQKNGFFCK